jgi:hypothetical protein
MLETPQSRSWRIRPWKVAVAGIILLTAYCGSFFALHRGMSVTFMVGKNFRLYSVNVIYFSKNRRINYAAWLFYYPLHRQSADSLKRLDDAFFVEGGGDEMARLGLRTFYVADVEMLYRAQVIGFHPKKVSSD